MTFPRLSHMSFVHIHSKNRHGYYLQISPDFAGILEVLVGVAIIPHLPMQELTRAICQKYQ